MTRPLLIVLVAAGLLGNSATVGPSCGNFGTRVYRVGDSGSSRVTSVAVADFNGDGRPDVAALTTNDQGSGYLSKMAATNDGLFGAPTTTFVGLEPQAIVAADMDQDGRPDVVVACRTNYDAVGNRVSANNIYVEATGRHYDGGISPRAIAAGDVDGDGKPDLLIGRGGPNLPDPFPQPGVVTILRASAYFATPTTVPIGSNIQAIVAADFNGDGKLDIAVANAGTNDVSVALGNGDATFRAPATFAVGSQPSAMLLGDFNGDHKKDLAVTNYVDGTMSILLGNGDGTFVPARTFVVGPSPVSIAVGHINGDQNQDLTVGFGNDSAAVFLGDGNGGFQSASTYALPGIPRGLALADLNGDGRTDLAAGADGPLFTFLPGNGDGTFVTPRTYAAGNSPSAVVAGDFNGDGRKDLAVTNSGSGDVSILLGNGSGAFSAPVHYATGSDPRALAVADFNGDGRPDIVVSNQGSHDMSILLGKGDGTFFSAVNYQLLSAPVGVAAADFNGDGKVDLIFGSGEPTMSTLRGRGDGTFEAPVGFSPFSPNGNHPEWVSVGDFNRDGHPDLAIGTGELVIALNRGDGTFASTYRYNFGPAFGALVSSVAVSDFDGDGLLDLAVPVLGDTAILTGRPDGSFDMPPALYGGPRWYVGDGPVVADVNGDGHADLIGVSEDLSSASVIFGHGDGTFAAATNYLVARVRPQLTACCGSWPQIPPAVADFDGDGRMDIATISAARNGVTVLLNTCPPTPNPEPEPEPITATVPALGTWAAAALGVLLAALGLAALRR